MRKRPFIASILCSLVAALLFAHHGPTTVTITAGAKKKQPPVTFAHGKHATTLVKSCDTCHHTQKGLTKDADADVKKCSTCHLDPKENVPSMSEMSLAKNPLHALCIDCHKTQKKGPTACTGCHVKKKS